MGGKGSGRNRTAEYAAMREYKAQGHTMQDVADKFGVSKGTAQRACKGVAVDAGRRIGSEKVSVTLLKKNAESAEERGKGVVERYAPAFEYVGGYTDHNGYVDIKCKACGNVMRRTCVALRHNRPKCENCERIAKEEITRLKAETEKTRRKIEAEKRAWVKAGKRKAKQLSFALCECCGSLFFPTRGCNKKYCSEECANKHHNSTKKDRRMRKLSTVMVDKDITLKDLFKRDGGVCSICGKRCRWDDKQELADGTIVTHKDYPSVDHIVPLSKGGKHAWDNIQLACRSCNSRKGDRF